MAVVSQARITRISRVEHARAAREARGEGEAFFPRGHPLARLVRASYSKLCEALADYDLNLLFNQTADPDDPRSAFRQDYGALLGPGMNLIMPTAGAYLCCPGRNRVFLPAATDRTLADYLQRAGFLGEVLYHDGLDDMVQELRRSGRRVYSIDDLGPGTDDCTVNSQRNMERANSKQLVGRLSAYAAEERHVDMFAASEQDFGALHVPGRRVYLKTCNTENAGEGVFPVADLAEFRAALEEIRERTRRYDLNPTLVLQPEIVGQNKSFQVFLDPRDPERLSVVALTDQLIGADGKKYAGSVNHVVTAERLEPVGPAILDLADRLWAECPGAFGFVMCDYFEQEDGRIVTFDPGLRPSSNTAAAMVKLWIEEAAGVATAVTNSPWVDAGEPGLPYAVVEDRLGPYADPDAIVARRFGALPRGHNHLQGKTRLIIITPTADDYPAFRAEIEQRVQG
jgi:hypothetical protein